MAMMMMIWHYFFLLLYLSFFGELGKFFELLHIVTPSAASDSSISMWFISFFFQYVLALIYVLLLLKLITLPFFVNLLFQVLKQI